MKGGQLESGMNGADSVVQDTIGLAYAHARKAYAADAGARNIGFRLSAMNRLAIRLHERGLESAA